MWVTNSLDMTIFPNGILKYVLCYLSLLPASPFIFPLLPFPVKFPSPCFSHFCLQQHRCLIVHYLIPPPHTNPSPFLITPGYTFSSRDWELGSTDQRKFMTFVFLDLHCFSIILSSSNHSSTEAQPL